MPEDIEPSHLSLLGVVAIALFVEEYDIAMLTAALPRIAADLGVAWEEMSRSLGVVRLGALPAFFVIPFADRIGRRRVFLVSVLMTGLLTFFTAFSQTVAQFIALQTLTRTFFVTGSAVAFVVVAEELPALRRGWGLGILGALGASGHGLALAFYSLVDLLPFGWRALYVVGVAPVLFFPIFRRRLPETRRYQEHQKDASLPAGAGLSGLLAPLRSLARRSPGRALGIAMVGFFPSIGLISAFQFAGAFTQSVRGWSPGEYAAMSVLAGAVGIVGNVVAGRMGDGVGRRVVGSVLLASFPLWVALFYRGPGWFVPVAWAGIVFAASGGRIILRALATELFPTSERASSSGLFAILDTLGGATGLFLLATLQERWGSDAISWLTPTLAMATLVGGIVLVFFPETRQRELEDLSG